MQLHKNLKEVSTDRGTGDTTYFIDDTCHSVYKEPVSMYLLCTGIFELSSYV